MAEIVRNWLTFKLGLEIPSTSDTVLFRRELANGILFAEVLRKYGILSDDEFVSLRHSNSRKSRAKNMLSIEKWVTDSGMPISHGMLMDIAKERVGAGVKFLYEMFLWLDVGGQTRKQEDGAKAKSYLQKRSFSSAWSKTDLGRRDTEEGGGQEGPRGSQPVDPCLVPIQRKWERSLSMAEDADLLQLQALQQPQPNWYTTLDPVPVPGMVLQTAPYGETGEAGEAEELYFTAETIEILRKQGKVRAEFKSLREQRLEGKVPGPVPWESYYFCPAEGACEKEMKRRQRECAQVSQTWLQMDQFDQNKKMASSKKERSELKRVYCDGRGDAAQLERSLAAIKCRLRTQAQESETRMRTRRAAAKRLVRNIPCEMFSLLQTEVMDCLTRLPTSERLLAEFIFQGHLQRQSIIKHTVYEAAQLIQVRQFDIEKHFQAQQAGDELGLELAGVELVKPDRTLLDPDEEARRLEKEAMVEALLNNLSRLVVKVAAYRASAGKECFEAELTPRPLEAGAPPEYRILLDSEDEFVMEPAFWAGPSSKTKLQEILPPLLQMTPELLRAEEGSGQEDKFLIKHIALLLDRFLEVGSGSLIPVRLFSTVLEDLLLLSIRCVAEGLPHLDYLPAAWLRLTPPLLRQLVAQLMGKRGFINWRNFLIACINLPYPSQTMIIRTLDQFQELDPQGAFFINKFGFDQVRLWFETPEKSSSLRGVFETLHVRECLFYLFADAQGQFYYVDFLLYFAKDQDPLHGIIKALAVLTGREIRVPSNLPDPQSALLKEGMLTDSDMDLFFQGTVLPHKRDSLVPQNTPKRKSDFSSRMSALRRRYKLFTSVSGQDNQAPNMEQDESEAQALLARLTLEEEKNEASRLIESETKRKRKICHVGHHHHKHPHFHLTPKSSMTSGWSDIRLHDLDRLKLLFEKEMEGEAEIQDPQLSHKTPPARTETEEIEEETERPISPPPLEESGGSGGAEEGLSTAEAQTQTPTEEDEEEEGEGEGEEEGEGASFQEQPLHSNTIPSEAFLQAIWFGHITSFPVHDPSFLSTDYFKYKEVLQVAYEELYSRVAVMDGEVYMSYLTQILEHPFVVEIIKRFVTYKIVDLHSLLQKVRGGLVGEALETDPLDKATPSPVLTDGIDEFLGEFEMEGESDGMVPRVARSSLPKTPGQRLRSTSVLTGKKSKKNRKGSKTKTSVKKSLEGKGSGGKLVSFQTPSPPRQGAKGTKHSVDPASASKKPKSKKRKK